MRWVLFLYGVAAAYLLYMGFMHTYVFFANRNLGFDESFFSAGMHLGLGILFAAFSFLGWFLYQHPKYSKWFTVLFYLPIGIFILYVLWAVFIFLTNEGRWN